jgi:hypothetical protein
MENMLLLEEEVTGIKELDDYPMDLKTIVLMQALLGEKSLNDILLKYNISEEIFYLWKLKYLK